MGSRGARYTACALMSLFLFACTTPWQEARQKNTPEAYRTFLKQNPKGSRAKEARNRLEGFAWDRAKQTNTIESYTAFLDAFPNGRRKNTASNRLFSLKRKAAAARETADWKAAEASDDPVALQAFIDKYPKTKHRGAAAAQIVDLKLPPLVRLAKQGKLDDMAPLMDGASADVKARALMMAAWSALHTNLSYKMRGFQVTFLPIRSSKVPRSTYVKIIRKLMTAGADPRRYAYIDFGSVAVRNYEARRKVVEKQGAGALLRGAPVRTSIGGPVKVRLVRRRAGGLSLHKICEIEKAGDILKIIARR